MTKEWKFSRRNQAVTTNEEKRRRKLKEQLNIQS